MSVLQRAIIVDRLPLVRLGMARILETEEVDVVAEFADGRPALAALDVERMDLILLGQLDDLSCVSMVKKVKAFDPAPTVICLLPSVSHEDLAELVHSGANAIVLRSASGKELAETLRRVRSGERVVAPSLVPLTVGEVHSMGADNPELPSSDRAGLTRKEFAVLKLLAEGKSTKDIATELYVTSATIKTHLQHIYGKLGAKDRHEALARALALGLLS